MKNILLLAIVFYLPFAKVCAQGWEFLVGLSATHSYTEGNIFYDIEPTIFPSTTFKEGQEPGVYTFKSVDWITTKNYFGIEPSAELGYHVGKDFTLGLGLCGRHRKVEYDLFLPVFEGFSLYASHFNLDLLFLATTLYGKFYDKNHKWNLTTNIGFNIPLTKIDNAGSFETIINNYFVREHVVGPEKGIGGLDFTNYILYRIGINRRLSDRFEMGVTFEHQFQSFYGADIWVDDSSTNERILVGHVYGRDISLGVRLGYNVFNPTK